MRGTRTHFSVFCRELLCVAVEPATLLKVSIYISVRTREMYKPPYPIAHFVVHGCMLVYTHAMYRDDLDLDARAHMPRMPCGARDVARRARVEALTHILIYQKRLYFFALVVYYL